MVEACTGAGATAVAVRLAVALAERIDGVAYLESNDCSCPRCRRRNRAFYAAGLAGSVFAGRFADLFYLRFLGGRADKRLNLFREVNWAFRTEESPCFVLRPEDIAGRLVIWDDPPEPADSDLILCVASAKADVAAAEAQTLKELKRLYGPKLKLVINHIGSEAELRRAETIFGSRGDFFLQETAGEGKFSLKNAADMADMVEYIQFLC